VAIAGDVIDTFPDGIHFVDLAPVREAELVLPTVAQILGMRGGGNLPVTERLANLLRGRRNLLVFDNFEQVLPAAGEIRVLLSACPLLTLLITSREPLRIEGEREIPIAPLALPDPMHMSSADEMALVSAVRLFTERAQATLPSFTLTAENAGPVGEICRRVDGLPLAIELAAARIKVLPPVAMLARLEQRLPVLSSGRRDLPVRQQTMRGAIAWSHDLLTESEQTLFRRLGVFVGGLSLEGAEAVMGSPDNPGIDVLDGIASLVDKSLLRLDQSDTVAPRYLMLETVREFALEQLVTSGETEALRDAHAAWCIDLAERWWADSVSLEQAAVQRRLKSSLVREYDNVRSALFWLDATGNDEGIAQLTGAMWWFWVQHGHRHDGPRWLKRAAHPVSRGAIAPVLHLRVMQGIAVLAHDQGDYAAATAAAIELGAKAHEIGDLTMEAMSQVSLGYQALSEGKFELSESLTRQAVATLDKLDKPRWDASLETHLGLAAYGRGDLPRAASLFEHSLIGHRRFGDTLDEAMAIGYLGLVRLDQSRVTEAAAQIGNVLPLWHTASNLDLIAEWLCHAAAVAATAGQVHQAGRLLGASVVTYARQGLVPLFPEDGWMDRTERAVRQALGDDAFVELRHEGQSLSSEQAIAEASALLASVADGPERDQTSQVANPFNLTARELDVLRLLVEGKPDREIAEALFIGTRTIETHVSNLLAKLDVHNRAEAAALAVRNDLV
jgi:predicted ATPase/DNA-binding CsgD family transcriptional regulator